MNTRIKQIRSEAGLSQRAFGARIGISGPSVTKLESGENNPSQQTIQLLCQHFGVRKDWLLYGEEPMRVPVTNRLQIVDEALDGEDEHLKDVIVGLSQTFGWDKMVGVIYAMDNVVKAFQANPGSLDLLSEALSAIVAELKKNNPDA
jgi:transcriptional regulator with XRE-family HTH domain